MDREAGTFPVRMISSLLFVLIAFLLSTIGATQAHAAPSASDPKPIRTIQTPQGPILVYDRAQILALSDIRTVQHQVSSKKASGVTPLTTSTFGNGNVTLYIHSVITWVYRNGKLVCGFFSVDATTVPTNYTISESGYLYINNSLVDEEFDTALGDAYGVTPGCYYYYPGAYWHGHSDVTVYQSPGNPVLNGWGDVSATQPG